jgi:hypothetical protein
MQFILYIIFIIQLYIINLNNKILYKINYVLKSLSINNNSFTASMDDGMKNIFVCHVSSSVTRMYKNIKRKHQCF